MGLYVIECPTCKKPFHYFSGNADQRCGVCKMADTKKPENVSTFSGAMNSNDSGEVVSTKVENKPAPREYWIAEPNCEGYFYWQSTISTTSDCLKENDFADAVHVIEQSAYAEKCEELHRLNLIMHQSGWVDSRVHLDKCKQLKAAQKEIAELKACEDDDTFLKRFVKEHGPWAEMLKAERAKVQKLEKDLDSNEMLLTAAERKIRELKK